MRKRAFLLAVILIFAVISTAGCTYQAIHLDTDKEPYTSTTPEIGGLFNMYAYDDFVMWEYIDETAEKIIYGINFNEGVIPENDWQTKCEEALTAVREYHAAKYGDALEIKDVTIREQYEDGLHKAYWTYLSPNELTFSVLTGTT
ncbi:hypothetical protein Mlab_0802 [Methanocorpusculum labreanum Z]|uniref:Lipoprotein n=1 Tax=Methanocorpusculum labreanum (strain ATCC 43576 / DSM 4855 / Z) TaxID=410358 RepID=A2SRL7_METLZ|nr:hypothetical protein [Methanocorpusculum labreanum]ABN06973.1 hypothetical protein Mlab_0802 [Methanocorpusculum labreanum Z]